VAHILGSVTAWRSSIDTDDVKCYACSCFSHHVRAALDNPLHLRGGVTFLKQRNVADSVTGRMPRARERETDEKKREKRRREEEEKKERGTHGLYSVIKWRHARSMENLIVGALPRTGDTDSLRGDNRYQK